MRIFYFSFWQNTNLHLYKWARLSSSLFTLFQNILSQHFSIFETAKNDMAQIDPSFKGKGVKGQNGEREKGEKALNNTIK